MKVLFVIAQLDYADHIAIPYLSAVAKAHNWESELCVLAFEPLIKKIEDFRPDVVAYSANVFGYEVIRKEHCVAAQTFSFVSILGGPQATFSPNSFTESGMDAFCLGEGEAVFGEFLDRVKTGASFDDLPNLITRKRNNPVRPLIAELDSIPFPDRDITLAHSYLKDTPKKTFYTTRGCPYKCSYCCNNHYHNLYRGKGRFVRRFSVERIICEMELVMSKYRTDFIKIGDDCFALNVDQWLEEFAEQYRKRIGIPFNCYLRIDSIDESMLRLLKNAGCFSVHLSVDSTSKHVREKIFGRNFREIDIEGVLKMIHSFGINTWVNFMLAAPESTLEDDLETIRVSKRGKVTYPAFSTTVPMLGTDLYDYCLERNFIDESVHKSDMAGCNEKSTLNCFSEREKNIRFNVYLTGAIIAKLPFPLDWLATQIIKVVPPNRFFRKLRQSVYLYHIENKIFKLHLDKAR